MEKADIERLARELTHDEYNLGRDMFSAMKEEGTPSSKAAAMCYRAGYRQAITDDRARRKRYHMERLAREAQEEAKQAEAAQKPKISLIAGYDALTYEELQAASLALDAMFEDTTSENQEVSTNE